MSNLQNQIEKAINHVFRKTIFHRKIQVTMKTFQDHMIIEVGGVAYYLGETYVNNPERVKSEIVSLYAQSLVK